MNLLWEDVRSHRDVLIEMVKKEKIGIIAEIGVWKSGLTSTLLKECGDIITQYWAVDPWEEIVDITDSNYERDMDRYINTAKDGWDNGYFKACKLMREFRQLNVVRLESAKAATIFPKNYFDLVFIDADHRYKNVLSDLKSWYPLVKKGMFFTGHDYKYSHEGTMRAVDEYLGEKFEVIKNSSVWVCRK